MTGPGRPKVGQVVVTRLPDDVIAHLDRWAKAHDISRAEAIRIIVTIHLSR